MKNGNFVINDKFEWGNGHFFRSVTLCQTFTTSGNGRYLTNIKYRPIPNIWQISSNGQCQILNKYQITANGKYLTNIKHRPPATSIFLWPGYEMKSTEKCETFLFSNYLLSKYFLQPDKILNLITLIKKCHQIIWNSFHANDHNFVRSVIVSVKVWLRMQDAAF